MGSKMFHSQFNITSALAKEVFQNCENSSGCNTWLRLLGINDIFLYIYFLIRQHLKIGISDSGTPQPNRDLHAETLPVKL